MLQENGFGASLGPRSLEVLLTLFYDEAIIRRDLLHFFRKSDRDLYAS